MKKACFLLFFLGVVSLALGQSSKPTIVYLFDPLCSWCYAFEGEMEKLNAKYKGRVDFTVVAGGMITGNSVKPISSISEFMLETIPELEEKTGVTFGPAYVDMLKIGTELTDSERPSWAVNAIRSFGKDEIDFASQLQKAFFFEGNSLNQDSTYEKLAAKSGVDKFAFLKVMYSDSIRTVTKENFKKVEESGVGGFPTVLLKRNGKVHLLVEGYERFEKLDKKLEKLLKD